MRAPIRPTVEVWMLTKSGAKIRRERKRAGYTQVELAALTRVTQQYISLLETSRDRDCSVKVAERICKYLNVDLEDLFEERSITRLPSVTTSSRVTRSAVA